MTEALIETVGSTYVRVGRNAVEDIYENLDYDFQIGKAVMLKGVLMGQLLLAVKQLE